MSTQVFRPENRLAHILTDAGGADTRQLLANAEAQLAEMAGSLRTYVFERLQAILALARLDDAALHAEIHVLGAASLAIAEVAAAADLARIGQAAAGLSALTGAFIENGGWRADAVRVHLDALQLLAKDDGQAPDHEQMLARLRAMREAIGVEE